MSNLQRALGAESDGDLERAVAHLRVAVRDDPEDRDAWAALARLHQDLGDLDRATAGDLLLVQAHQVAALVEGRADAYVPTRLTH